MPTATHDPDRPQSAPSSLHVLRAPEIRDPVELDSGAEPNERKVAVGIAGSGRVGTIALQECIVARLARFGGDAPLSLDESATAGTSRQTGTELPLSEPGPLSECGGVRLAATR